VLGRILPHVVRPNAIATVAAKAEGLFRGPDSYSGESEVAWSMQRRTPALRGGYADLVTFQSRPPALIPLSALSRKKRRLAHWLSLRDFRYIVKRLLSLVRRYGLTPRKAERRIVQCVESLAVHDCRPTLFTPGFVVSRNSGFCRSLEGSGVELGVHGFDHVDFRGLSRDEANQQFTRAAAAFTAARISFEGFRCPYLSCSPQRARVIASGHVRLQQ
jgi:peptidoglycan/xylan/chitin deacetylase (PgdA/CDA1 family)